MRVLVVEDSERLRRSLEHGLRNSGFGVDLAADGEEGLALARRGGYDVVVLDLMMPKMDGLTVLRRLRESGSKVHVLILSAKDHVAERVDGLAAGADDYLIKPFAFDELVARLQALVRRKYGTKDPVQRIGPLEIDTARRQVSNGSTVIPLTPHEYRILERLLVRRGTVVTKDELIAHLYAGEETGSANAIEVFVHQLRRKLHVEGRGDPIETRRGHGYVIA